MFCVKMLFGSKIQCLQGPIFSIPTLNHYFPGRARSCPFNLPCPFTVEPTSVLVLSSNFDRAAATASITDVVT